MIYVDIRPLVPDEDPCGTGSKREPQLDMIPLLRLNSCQDLLTVKVDELKKRAQSYIWESFQKSFSPSDFVLLLNTSASENLDWRHHKMKINFDDSWMEVLNHWQIPVTSHMLKVGALVLVLVGVFMILRFG